MSERFESVTFASLAGRLTAHLIVPMLVAVALEGWLALALYPALSDVVQDGWFSVVGALWSASVLPILVVVFATSVVAVGLGRVIGVRWATFGAGVIVAGGVGLFLAPLVVRIIFPTRLPWDRSFVAVIAALVVVIPAASVLFGLWVRFVATRRVSLTLASATAVALLLAAPGWVVDLSVQASPTSGQAPIDRGSAILRDQPVVLVTVDTLRASHMSVYGYERDTTPGLARWAREGIVFTQAITPRTFHTPRRV